MLKLEKDFGTWQILWIKRFIWKSSTNNNNLKLNPKLEFRDDYSPRSTNVLFLTGPKKSLNNKTYEKIKSLKYQDNTQSQQNTESNKTDKIILKSIKEISKLEKRHLQKLSEIHKTSLLRTELNGRNVSYNEAIKVFIDSCLNVSQVSPYNTLHNKFKNHHCSEQTTLSHLKVVESLCCDKQQPFQAINHINTLLNRGYVISLDLYLPLIRHLVECNGVVRKKLYTKLFTSILNSGHPLTLVLHHVKNKWSATQDSAFTLQNQLTLTKCICRYLVVDEPFLIEKLANNNNNNASISFTHQNNDLKTFLESSKNPENSHFSTIDFGPLFKGVKRVWLTSERSNQSKPESGNSIFSHEPSPFYYIQHENMLCKAQATLMHIAVKTHKKLCATILRESKEKNDAENQKLKDETKNSEPLIEKDIDDIIKKMPKFSTSITSIKPFNKLLQTWAKLGEIGHMQSLVHLMYFLDLKPDYVTFASFLEATGRYISALEQSSFYQQNTQHSIDNKNENDFKLIDDCIKSCVGEIEKLGQNHLPSLLINYKGIKDEPEYILKAIKRIYPTYEPMKPTITRHYDNVLLNNLPIEKEIKPTISGVPYTGIMPDLSSMVKAFNEQIQIEKRGIVKIASIFNPTIISKTNDSLTASFDLQNITNNNNNNSNSELMTNAMDKTVKKRLEKYEKLRKERQKWRKILTEAFDKSLNALKHEWENRGAKKGYTVLSYYPLLKCVPTYHYIDMLLNEIEFLSTSAQYYSPSTLFLYRHLGLRVNHKYIVLQKLEKDFDVKLKAFYKRMYGYMENRNFDYYAKNINNGNHNLNNESEFKTDIPRSLWNKTCLDSMRWNLHLEMENQIWPTTYHIGLGRFLYSLILENIKVKPKTVYNISSAKVYDDITMFPSETNNPTTDIELNNIENADLEQIGSNDDECPAFFSVYREFTTNQKEEFRPHPIMIKLHEGCFIDDNTLYTTDPQLTEQNHYFSDTTNKESLKNFDGNSTSSSSNSGSLTVINQKTDICHALGKNMRKFQSYNVSHIKFEANALPMLVPPLPWSTIHSGGYLLHTSPLVRLSESWSFHYQILNRTPNAQLLPVLDSLTYLGMCPWRINTQILDLVIHIFNANGMPKLGIPSYKLEWSIINQTSSHNNNIDNNQIKNPDNKINGTIEKHSVEFSPCNVGFFSNAGFQRTHTDHTLSEIGQSILDNNNNPNIAASEKISDEINFQNLPQEINIENFSNDIKNNKNNVIENNSLTTKPHPRISRKVEAEMYSLWCDTLYKLSIANHYRDRVFWLPHNMDFRSRVYPIPPQFNHLTSDLFRSLFLFAKGQPLGPKGFEWIKLHLANLTGKLKRKSIPERLAYIESVIPMICACAKEPLKPSNNWWMKADDPWQTLACCMEITKILSYMEKYKDSDPLATKYICHFPIHQDGSCNGLQHYAALGRDEQGGAQVNLLPYSKPRDVYTAVADTVDSLRLKDAQDGLEIAQILEGKIGRKIVKQTVMTVVYGVTHFGAKEQIGRQLEALTDFPRNKIRDASLYLVEKTFESIKTLFTATREIQEWFTECARMICTHTDLTLEWITPLGFPVVQPYSRKTLISIPKVFEKDNASNLQLRSGVFEKPITQKQKNAFPPNFIHSLDSTHMMLTAQHCQQSGLNFVAVHDCFWTHAAHVDIMNKICRQQFVALHKQPILANLSDFFVQTYSYSNEEIVKAGRKSQLVHNMIRLNRLICNIPQKGKLEIDKVMDSTFFFS